ncbi:MAG TPA: pantoate--beta-alanine ligase, partial [Chitinophagaceae bacterium]
IGFSRKENDITICSIFVNPAQFNDLNDYNKYPSTLDQDILKLEQSLCDLLFLPAAEEIFPDGFSHQAKYDLGYIEMILEGEFRPGHFQGVCLAVDRLLRVVAPENLYLGQKDYQQCMVITRLIDVLGLSGKIKIRICPIMREPDGLAMSSRNMRLNPQQRLQAPAIHRSLVFLRDNISKGSLEQIKKEAINILEDAGFKPDYVELADTTTLKPINEWDSRAHVLALAAASLDGIRLIDNMILN